MTRVAVCGCGSADISPTGVRIQFPQAPYSLARCSRCGRRMLDPIPSDAELAAAYDEQYYGAGGAKFIAPIEAFVEHFRGTRAREAVRLVSGIAPATEAPRRVLDVGCGSGQFLARLIPLGYEAHGTEFSEQTGRRAAAVPGLRLHVGPLRADSYPAQTFDLISIWHVLEHLRDPDEALRWCRGWLRPGGLLMLAVPNVSSWQAKLFRGAWFHLDPPRHLQHFDPASLQWALGSARFRSVRVRHLSMEQNLYGYAQSALNALGFPREQLYERLKGNRPAATAASLALQAALVGLLLPPIVVLALAEAAFASGGTIECVAARLEDP